MENDTPGLALAMMLQENPEILEELFEQFEVDDDGEAGR